MAFLNAQAALEALPQITDLLAEELKWDSKRKQREWEDTVEFLASMGLPKSKLGVSREDVETGKAGIYDEHERKLYSRHGRCCDSVHGNLADSCQTVRPTPCRVIQNLKRWRIQVYLKNRQQMHDRLKDQLESGA